MKKREKNEEWVGNLQEELEEIRNIEMKVEEIETYGSISQASCIIQSVKDECTERG